MILKGPYAGAGNNSEVLSVIKSVVMPNVKDVYRNNQQYGLLAEADKVKVSLLIKALKGSKMLKVCKDGWHVKRRLAFTEALRKDV